MRRSNVYAVLVAVASLVLILLTPTVASGDTGEGHWLPTTIVPSEPAQLGPGVAVADDGTIYTTRTVNADDGGRVIRIDPDGTITPLPWTWSFEPWIDATGENGSTPMALAVDDAGDLFALMLRVRKDAPDGAGVFSLGVMELATGAQQPVNLPVEFAERTVPNYCFLCSFVSGDIAVSSGGDLYVAASMLPGADDSETRVLKLAHGATEPVDLPFGDVTRSTGIDVDDAGNVYLADAGGPSGASIRVLRPGASSAEVLVDAGSQPALSGLGAIALGGADQLFFSAGDDLAVLDTTDPTGSSTDILHDSGIGGGFSQLAADPAGVLYFANNTQGGLERVAYTNANPITATDATVATISGKPVNVQLTAEDSSGAELTYTHTKPAHGKLTGDGAKLTYTAGADFTGTDTFQFTAGDAYGFSATGTVTIKVAGLPYQREPVAKLAGEFPLGIANAPDGSVYVADTVGIANPFGMEPTDYTGTVRRIHPDGTTSDTDWTFDFGTGVPSQLATDAEGNLYGLTIDVDRDIEVKELPHDGGPVTTLPFTGLLSAGTLGEGNDAYVVAPSLDVDAGGDVFVSDPLHSRILRLAKGAAAPSPLPNGGGVPIGGLAVDSAGDLFGIAALQGARGRLMELPAGSDSGWTQLSSDGRLPGPSTVGVDASPEGNVFVYVAEGAAENLPGVLEFPARDYAHPVLAANAEMSFGRLTDDGGQGFFMAQQDPDAHNGVWVYHYTPRSQLSAVDSDRTVPAGQSSILHLPASAPAGTQLTYQITTPPAHGTLAGSGADRTYTPDDGYAGPDKVVWSVRDESGGRASATVSITVAADGTDAVTQTADPGEPVSTGTAVGSDTPTQAEVTSPTAGEVTITRVDAADATTTPDDYGVVGSQYVIDAPHASAAKPLRLSFRASTDALPPGQDPGTVTVFRDGVAIGECVDDSGTADPDPCVTSRTVDGDVLTITVLSSHASTWTLGVHQSASRTDLTVRPQDTTWGDQVTLTAQVSASIGLPGGEVTFTDGDTELGEATLGADGIATLKTSRLGVGKHQVVAKYSGDVAHRPSTSETSAVRVRKVRTALTADPTLIRIGPGLKIHGSRMAAHLVRADNGRAIPGASIVFKSAGRRLCTATTDARGTASCKPTGLAALFVLGYTANYPGDSHHVAATAHGHLIGRG